MNRLLAMLLGVGMLLTGIVAMAQDTRSVAPGGKGSAAQATAQMDEHMRKMQALHERMMSAATPEERQKAMEDARKEMQDSMDAMRPMMQGGGMMGGAMMGRGGMGGGGMAGKGGPPVDRDTQMQMMGKRMDMMQMMMQMMMDQQAMMGPPKGPEPAPKK